ADHLIVAVKKLAISKGHHRIVLSVSDHNLHAKNLYLKHGFQFISNLDGISLCSDTTDTKSQKMECFIKGIDLD
ncbi:GNAT family N-acetyltransferase, partial [Acinetobacter venetianus]